MSRHSRPRKTMIPFYVREDEAALIRAIRAYRDGLAQWSKPEHLYYRMVPTGANIARLRQPGKHARRWDA